MKHITVVLLMLAVPYTALAQSTTGNLEGRVVDTTGAAVVGANVQVASDALQGTRGGISDELGHFRLPALPPGSYSVKISHIGGVPVTLDNIRIFLGRTTNAGEIVLRERRIELEGVVATSARPLIDPRSTVTGVNLTDSRFRNLPIDRSYLTMMQLAPQSSPSFYGDGINIAGATGVENRFFIDGTDATDPYRGISGTQLPYNFVREVEVRSGAYEAEYSSALGGVVNAITYSGGNEMHGQAFGCFTNNRFSGSPRLSVGKPPSGSFTEYDVGVGLGGPVVTDQLWYFLAYNPKFQREDVPVLGQANQEDRATTHMFAAKLSWNVNESNLLTLSAVGDPSVRRGVGVDFRNGGMAFPWPVLDLNCWLSDITKSSTSIVLGGTHIMSQNLLLESTVSYARRSAEYKPVAQSEPYLFTDYLSGTQSGTLQYTYDKEVTLHGGLRGTMTLDAHTLKAGIGYSGVSYDAIKNWEWLFHAYFQGPDTVVPWLHQFRDFSGNISMRNPWVFLQDSWRLSERMTFNVGCRWDPQFMYASDGGLRQEITKALGPRLGIIYQPGMIGSQRITASAGRFYQPLSLSLSTLVHVGGLGSDNYYLQDPRVNKGDPVYVVRFGGNGIANIKDLEGQYYDEFTLGYERALTSFLKAGARVVYRNLGDAVTSGMRNLPSPPSLASSSVYGNPGSYPLEEYPRAKREYASLELTLEQNDPTGLSLQVSYVLSRNYGNYEGLSEITFSGWTMGGMEMWPNGNLGFDSPEMMKNSTGLLPDDRTHAFKFSCSYPFSIGLTVGASGYWTSGTPLNDLGTTSISDGGWPVFLQPRGSAGRTPAIWDANLRFVYDLAGDLNTSWHPRVILDVLHIFSQKKAVDFDQMHYWGSDTSDPNALNATFNQPIAFQPPMSARLGMELNF
jgi:hypothetical protein